MSIGRTNRKARPAGRRRLLAGMAAAAAGLLLAGCEARIRLDYGPAAGVAAVPGASSTFVRVTAVDRRTQNRDRVSTKNGMLQSPVRAETDVVELVRRAVETELKAEGFAIGPGGAEIVVELEDFYSDYVKKFFDSAAEASVSFSLRVKDRAGITRYTHLYDGQARAPYIAFETGDLVKQTLERALAAAARQVIDDKALAPAILAAAGPAPASAPR